MAARALEFTILTVMRTDAVIPAARDEINEGVWTVPAPRMKGERAKEFRLPLSAAALAIAEKRREGGSTHFLFPGGKRGKPLSNMAMLKLLQRMGRGDLTVHGFRSTFKDWCHEVTDFQTEVIEKALAHAIDSKVEAAHRRGELFAKRRQLMEARAQFATSLPSTSALSAAA